MVRAIEPKRTFSRYSRIVASAASTGAPALQLFGLGESKSGMATSLSAIGRTTHLCTLQVDTLPDQLTIRQRSTEWIQRWPEPRATREGGQRAFQMTQSSPEASPPASTATKAPGTSIPVATGSAAMI